MLKDRGEDGRMTCVSTAAVAQAVAGAFAVLDQCLAGGFCFCCLKEENCLVVLTRCVGSSAGYLFVGSAASPQPLLMFRKCL